MGRRREADRSCASCGESLQRSSHAVYCSAACRQAAYRRRLRQAKSRGQCTLCQNVTEPVSTWDGVTDEAGVTSRYGQTFGVQALAEVLASAARALLSSAATAHTEPQPGRRGTHQDVPGEDGRDQQRGDLPADKTESGQSPVLSVMEVPAVVGSVDVDRFYCEVIEALGDRALAGGTAFGAAAVVKRVARGLGVASADVIPLPRPTRQERDALAAASGRRVRSYIDANGRFRR